MFVVINWWNSYVNINKLINVSGLTISVSRIVTINCISSGIWCALYYCMVHQGNVLMKYHFSVMFSVRWKTPNYPATLGLWTLYLHRSLNTLKRSVAYEYNLKDSYIEWFATEQSTGLILCPVRMSARLQSILINYICDFPHFVQTNVEGVP
jgi:hypothetical protein